MAEIKSTFDIIMEKAKKFTITEEEKKSFRRQELEGKIRGLIQKYVDGILSPEKFDEEVRSLRRDDPVTVGRLMREEVMGRIRLGEDNLPLLDILSAAGMDAKPIRDLLRTFHSELKRKREGCEKAVRAALMKKGISGSAVVPNLNADEEWRKTLSESSEAFKKRLKSLA